MKKVTLFAVGFYLIFSLTSLMPFLHAQTYPNQPIQMIITLAPGDGLDVTGRAIAEQLAKILNTPIIPMNKPGAGGTFGTDYVVKSKKDGYTILYTNSNLIYTLATNPDNVPYNPFQDLEPLCQSGSVPLLVAVQAESPWKSFQELVDYIKKNPGKVRGGTTGIGTIGYFVYEIIQKETGTSITLVPFKGATPMFTALLGGHVEIAHPSLSVISPHLASGKVRALLTSKKIPEHPNIPTLTELGYKRDIPSVWNAFFIPAGVSDSVKKILVSALEKSIKSPDVINVMQKIGYVHDYRSGDEVKKSMREEYLTLKELIKAMGPIAK